MPVDKTTAIQKRFTEGQQEVDAIRERADESYCREPGEQYTPMLRDIRTLLGELNLITEFWQDAEAELAKGEMQPTDPSRSESRAVQDKTEKDCEDCKNAMRLAYSDATTPGFMYDRCDKHRVRD